jgi:uncharacterized protein YbjT (DUF2867 family)
MGIFTGIYMRKILIAGASGFIGRALIKRLLEEPEVQIIALSRSERTSDHERVSWIKCDLFSLKDISSAMRGSHEAYYLVHSMLPSASLSQGTFYDFDLIMADNFIRAGHHHDLQHIIYLGGMIPKIGDLSWHLRSRLEVEETFRFSGIRTTVLRAGLIVGPHGSSFTIVQKLIERLPVMICPAWTRTRSQPVALKDVIKVLFRCYKEKEIQGKIYDIAGPEVVTYQELIIRAAKKIRKSTTLITLNIIPLSISRLWVSVITGVPRDLVYPLILSLKHEMLPSPENAWPHPEDLLTSLDQSLSEALYVSDKSNYKIFRPPRKDVRSIQRLVLPPGRNAEWVALEYFKWLPSFLSSLVNVKVEGNYCTFYLFDPTVEILVLKKSIDRSSPDRQLLYVVGGLLSGKMDRGRLEFREVLNRQYVMAALHEFRPALPWFIYRWTQALAHLIVMKAFSEHLKWHFISGQKAKK